VSDAQTWYAVLAWLLVAACAYVAFVFGRLSRTSFNRYPRGHVPHRVRIGVAISINGPLLCFVAGVVVAIVVGNWLEVALGTFLAVIAVAGVGLYLAPR